MTFLQAAEAVLRRAKTPLTAAQITELALTRGLLHTHGKTPEATMSAALYGAPKDGAIQRESEAGRQRATRGSVPMDVRRRRSMRDAVKPQRLGASGSRIFLGLVWHGGHRY